MARNLLEPIFDGGVANPHYFEGRLLTAAALREEQDAQRAHHRRLGRALGPGIVDGLFVTVESPGSPTTAPLLAISAGLAINADGDTLELPAREVVALARTTDPARPEAGLFHTCPPPRAEVETPGFGFFVLVLSPASGFQGRAPFSGLSDPRAGSGCGSRWAVEGVRLRMVPLDPLDVTGLPDATRALLEDELLEAASEAGRSKLRNVVAHLCLGTLPLATFAADPFARDPLTGGGTEPALARYGALDDLLATGGLSGCDVPLALLHWPSASGLGFADNWAVRRRLAPLATSAEWPTLTGGRRRAEAEAALFQFQEQLGLLVERSTVLASLRMRDYFRWVPPAGLVPLAAAGRRGLAHPAAWTGVSIRQPSPREPAIYIDGERVPELLRTALAHRPFDLESGEFLWTYHVRQNHPLPADGGGAPTCLVFASGHLPFAGTARFDLARWDRSSLGLL
jgi:hypothetical protein